MQIHSKHIQERYLACCNTPLLWKGKTVNNLKQLDLPDGFSSVFLRKLEKRLRLGQLAEQFVFNQIESWDNTELLAENIQIKKEKQTLGELDALITLNGQPVHLEIIYKFYVYDDTIGTSEIERWIGPNRKDSLIEKLTKLKEKQLPLLYSEDCKTALNYLEIEPDDFEQQVLFKAQLFIPYQQEIEFQHLNKDCVYGFYLHRSQLTDFKTYQFYIPPKLDWFLHPTLAVEWLNFENFKEASQLCLDKGQSPLFWMKNNKGEFKKCFLVWW